jgi:hypothetical protein
LGRTLIVKVQSHENGTAAKFMRACMHATQMFCKHVAHQKPVVKPDEQHQQLMDCATYQFPCCLTVCNFEDSTEPSTGTLADFT